MLVVMQDKNINVRKILLITIENLLIFLGFEDGEYYPEKHPDYRVQHERIPVR
jgi:hypothetical protein